MSALSNLFYIGLVYFSNNKIISRYIISAYSNQDNYNQHDKSISNTANNNNSKSEARNFNGLRDNPDDLNKNGIYDELLAKSVFFVSRLLAVLAVLAGRSFFSFFFLYNPQIVDNAVLYFRFCVFLVAFSIFFLLFFQSFQLLQLLFVFSWSFYPKLFLPKHLLLISFSGFFFFVTCSLVIFVWPLLLTCIILRISCNFLLF